MQAVSEAVPTTHTAVAPAGNGGPSELAADATARLDGFVGRPGPDGPGEPPVAAT